MFRFAFAFLSIVLLTGVLSAAPARADAAPAYYDGLSIEVKKQIQQNLIWTGYYPGPIDGAIGAGALKAIKQFQVNNGEPASGVMSARVFTALGRFAEDQRHKINFQNITDKATGVRIGIPFAYISEQRETLRGMGYHSIDGNLEIETFAIFNAIRDLPSLYSRLKDQNSQQGCLVRALPGQVVCLIWTRSRPKQSRKRFLCSR